MNQSRVHEASITHNWQIESLRSTAFLPPSLHLGQPTWWSDLTGNQPETRISKPPIGQLQESGAFEDRTLVLSLQPGRVDWFLNPKASQVDVGEAEFRLVGRFPDALNLFVLPMHRWFNVAPPAIRLAFGATLLEPVEGRRAGYRRLSEFLPAIRIDPEGSEDFYYQINRPRNSTLAIEHLNINRLSRWSVTSYQKFRVDLALPSQQVIQSNMGETLFASRLDLDISTPAIFPGELPHGNIDAIFRELVSLGSEIALRGDIA